ncbi:Ectonucleotide pyrophosphatase/phosphodiesterase member 3 [Clonorchis sinensis]|uniref:Ectonucleotide pyrophosphatase/phosphodiesterase member 3 n=1 Tax=Clonorchis sinensis TaxID=79923 RepID=A0A8T1M1A2_CLOSI|nr:Ectonucleotide pyrophosphatase/phosphodiesterase member 3 [Clonorchis sinensis]
MPAIVLLPDPLWHLVHRRNESGEGGIHGYSPEFADMNPFLIASGPSFRKHEVVDQVYAIDIYTLMCWLLRVRPSANNGSLDRIANSLLKPEVAERLLSFEHWPEWFVWMAIELELMWFFMVVIVIASTATALGVSLHMQRRYSRLAEHSRDQYENSYSVVRLLEKDVGLATTSSYLKTSGRPNYQMSLRFSGTTRSSVTRIAVLNTTLPEYTGFQAKLATLMGFDSVFG